VSQPAGEAARRREEGSHRLIEDEIRHEVVVDAAPGAVYDALATAEGLDGWFTRGAAVEARPGGEIVFRWEAWGPGWVTAQDGGPVLEAERPERFAFQWHPDGPEYATTVEIDFERVDGGTRVRLREYGYRDTPSGLRAMLDCAAGWGEALALVKVYVEHGIRHRGGSMQPAEIAFFVDDVDASTAFYRALLGRGPVAASEGMAIFQAGATRILVHETYEAGEGALPPENHVAFAVQDLDATCAALRAQGLELEVAPRAYYWGRSAYLRAPDGQLIELAEQAAEGET
jgi:uncharacterized protein YndB with AHSA1/START domain/catechol 2,3-dioxygenase-like lactoylglutathione lyase family enzyme